MAEGKDCFRTLWNTKPTYSGGTIRAAHLFSQTEVIEEEGAVAGSSTTAPTTWTKTPVVVTPHRGTINLLHAQTGDQLSSYAVPQEDDLILHVDAINTWYGVKASGDDEDMEVDLLQEDDSESEAGEENDEDDAPKKEKKNAKKAPVLIPATYVAISTRALQVTVLKFEMLVAGGEVVCTVVKQWTAGQSAVGCLRFSPLGKFLASGSTDGNIRLWNVHSHFLTHNFRCKGGIVTTMAFEQQVGGAKQAATAAALLSEKEKPQSIIDTESSAEPEVGCGFLVAGTVEGYVTAWALGGDKESLGTARLHTSPVEEIFLGGGIKQDQALSKKAAANATVSASSRCHLVTIGRDRKIVRCPVSHMHNVEFIRETVITDLVCSATFHLELLEETKSKATVMCVSLHVGALDGALRSYKVPVINSGGPITKSREQGPPSQAAVKAAAEENDGEDEDATPKTKADDGEAEGTLADPKDPDDLSNELAVRSLAVFPDIIDDESNNAALMYANGTQSIFWAALTNRGFDLKHTLVCQLDQVLDIVAVPPKSSMKGSNYWDRLIMTNSNVAHIYRGTGSCATTETLIGHDDVVMTAQLSKDNKWILTGSRDRSLRVWDAETLVCHGIAGGKGTTHGHSAEVIAVSFNSRVADNAALMGFSVSTDSSVRVWDLTPVRKAKAENTAEVVQLNLTHAVELAHEGGVHCLAVAPNDAIVATGGKDKTIAIWNVSGAKKLARHCVLKSHKRGVNAVSFSPVDRLLVSGSNDGTVKVWSLITYTCARTIQVDRHGVIKAEFFNKGQQLITGGADGVVRFWAMGSGEAVASLEAHDDKLWALTVLEETEDHPCSFMTGSAGGEVQAIEDFTAEEAKRLKDEHSQTVQDEQALNNAVRRKEFAKAFHLALRLAHPRHLRGIVSMWAAHAPDTIEEEIAVEVAKLTEKLLLKLLEYTRLYSTNARQSHIASLLMKGFLVAYPLNEVTAKAPALQNVLEAIWSYARRHLNRQKQALQQLQFVDYVCRSITTANQQLEDRNRGGRGVLSDISKELHAEEEEGSDADTNAARGKRNRGGAAEEEPETSTFTAADKKHVLLSKAAKKKVGARRTGGKKKTTSLLRLK